MNTDGLPERVMNEKLTLDVLLYEFVELIVDLLVGTELGVVDKVTFLEITYVVVDVYVSAFVPLLVILGDIVIVTVKINDLVGVAVAVFVIIDLVWVLDIVIVLDDVVVDDCELEDVLDLLSDADFVDVGEDVLDFETGGLKLYVGVTVFVADAVEVCVKHAELVDEPDNEFWIVIVRLDRGVNEDVDELVDKCVFVGLRVGDEVTVIGQVSNPEKV